MPKLVDTIWQEPCPYVEELHKIGNRRGEVQVQEEKKCIYLGQGSTSAEALDSLRLHIQGKHSKEVEFRAKEAIKNVEQEDGDGTRLALEVDGVRLVLDDEDCTRGLCQQPPRTKTRRKKRSCIFFGTKSKASISQKLKVSISQNVTMIRVSH